VVVSNVGNTPWRKDARFCVVAEWKDSSLVPAATSSDHEYYSVDSPLNEVPNVLREEVCAGDALKPQESKTYTLTASMELPNTRLTIIIHAEADDLSKTSQSGGRNLIISEITRLVSP